MRSPVGFDRRGVDPSLPQRSPNGFDQRLQVEGIDDQAHARVGNGIAYAAAGTADYAQPTGRGLEIDDAKTLLRAWHDEKVGEPIELGKLLVGNEAQETHRSRRRRKLGRAGFEAGTIVAIADHHMDQLREDGAQGRQGGEDLLMALVALAGREAADGEQDRPPPQSEASPQCLRGGPGTN